ncbi:ACP S-malonyltransferase [Streptomyces sp. bgisy091]|uniref:ACP S-malonyltransferase n=1 Tax=Streptomyces sp. bgisy091 TaxID=3413778 RepID=UPI003D7538AC
MRQKTVFMFAGQGSQYYGMGRELLTADPVFRRSVQTLGEAFADLGMPGVRQEIYREDRGPAQRFDRLAHTHPAILMTELALVETLRSRGVEPDYVLGASLGEFAAATAAGALSVEDLARTIVQQVRLVEENCPPGGMTAVLDDVARYEHDEAARPGLELAAVNFDRHLVLSGATDDLARLEGELRGRGVPFQRLPVGYAFHSALMDTAADAYHQVLSRLELRKPSVTVVSCETAGTLGRIDTGHLWRMVRSPIRFREAVRYLESLEPGGLRYVDLGPSATMANFARHNFAGGSRSTTVPVLDPFNPAGRAAERIAGLAESVGDVRSRTSPARLLRSGPNSPPARPSQRGDSVKAIIFPGQGSQARGMGRDLFGQFPELTAEADSILGYSVERLCEGADPDRPLDSTRFTQPALYAVNALSYLARVRAGTYRADYFAGHSLGEYNALFAAGAFDFGTGLRLVRRRGELMAGMADGGMAAVIGLGEEAVRDVLTAPGLTGIDLANFNGGDQIVVSGPRDAVERSRQAFLDAGAKACIVLRVSGAFHSRHMAPARREFEEFLGGFAFQPLTTPVVANVTARPYEAGSVHALLADQLVRPVCWEQSVRYVMAQGEAEFEEVGPGTVLTGLVKKIRAAAPVAHAVPAAAPAAVPAPVTLPAPRPVAAGLRAEDLGSADFRAAYGVRYAYVCGSMYRGIASEEMVLRAARAGLLAFFGTGGLDRGRIDAAITRISGALGADGSYGMNLVHNPTLPAVEDDTVDLLLARGVRNLEASAFMKVTPALVRFRLAGLTKGYDGEVVTGNRIMAKVSRPEVAEGFLSPAPERIISRLEEQGLITAEQAALASRVPMADDLCVEADSGGHTDRGQPFVLLPAMLRLRDRVAAECGYSTRVRVGAAGGIGTPEAGAAALVMGADFLLTGSVNLCTVESAMSPAAKDMLEQINVQDTDYAPAGDMFELGAQVQVLKRGVFFPARARKLHDLYRRHESLDEIDAETRTLIETRYFRRTFDDVWRETEAYFEARDPREAEKARQNPKHRMALVFRWYFGHSQRIAMEGLEEGRVDFQVHCGPALGAFNQWVEGTPMESWRNRHVDEIGIRIMRETASCLEQRLNSLTKAGTAR